MKKSEKKTSERATRVRAAITPVKTIKRWLRVITRGKKAPGYATGTKLFLNAWHKKTPAEIKRLCEQIKEVTLRDDVLSQTEFGKGATGLLTEVVSDRVNWKYGRSIYTTKFILLCTMQTKIIDKNVHIISNMP